MQYFQLFHWAEKAKARERIPELRSLVIGRWHGVDGAQRERTPEQKKNKNQRETFEDKKLPCRFWIENREAMGTKSWTTHTQFTGAGWPETM